MRKERGLNIKIKALEQVARAAKERLEIVPVDSNIDHSMSKRRAGSDGGREYTRKESK